MIKELRHLPILLHHVGTSSTTLIVFHWAANLSGSIVRLVSIELVTIILITHLRKLICRFFLPSNLLCLAPSKCSFARDVNVLCLIQTVMRTQDGKMRKTKGVLIKRVQSINSKKEHGQQFANICIWKA